jgi:hypothetical protein
MFDEILSTLKSQAAPELMSKLGLNEQQTHGSINAAADSVKEVISGGDGFGMDDVMNLFSSAKNTPAADGIMSNIGNVLSSKLTGQVGLNPQQAGGVSGMLLPMITGLISSKVGGNAGGLQSLIGGLTGGSGGLGGIASGLVGKLFS